MDEGWSCYNSVTLALAFVFRIIAKLRSIPCHPTYNTSPHDTNCCYFRQLVQEPPPSSLLRDSEEAISQSNQHIPPPSPLPRGFPLAARGPPLDVHGLDLHGLHIKARHRELSNECHHSTTNIFHLLTHFHCLFKCI
jgi:hypothetical protein